MGVDISFRGLPTLEHINLRKEGDDHAHQIAVDLKISGLANIGEHGALIQKLLGCDPSHARIFWNLPEVELQRNDPHYDGPECAFHGITRIKVWAFYEGNHKAHICGLEFRPKKIHKFSFAPRPGYLLDLEFTISISGIEHRELNIITEHLGEEIRCRIEADSDDLFEVPADDKSREPMGVYENDPLYPDAVTQVVKARRASISFVQRKMKIGYNRAARLVEAMERQGVVSEAGHNGKREVLAPAEDQGEMEA